MVKRPPLDKNWLWEGYPQFKPHMEEEKRSIFKEQGSEKPSELPADDIQ